MYHNEGRFFRMKPFIFLLELLGFCEVQIKSDQLLAPHSHAIDYRPLEILRAAGMTSVSPRIPQF